MAWAADRPRAAQPGLSPTFAGGRAALYIPLLLALALASAGQHAARRLLPALRQARQAATPAASLPPPAAAAPIAPVFTPEVQAWAPEIARWAARAGLDPDLVATVMQIESCGHAHARSSAGASGLFQVMPFHFAAGEDPFDPETNARRGLAYLQRALELAGGRPDQALAGYNGGHSQIGRPPHSWPAETRRYVHWGSGILDEIRAGAASSARLDEWLAAGGASLCRQAAAASASG